MNGEVIALEEGLEAGTVRDPLEISSEEEVEELLDGPYVSGSLINVTVVVPLWWLDLPAHEGDRVEA